MGHVIGCIGCGNMGSALLEGFAKKLAPAEYSLAGFDHTPQKVEALQNLGVKSMPDCLDLVRKADIVMLAVKPHALPSLLQEIAPLMGKEKLVISIAAGMGLSTLRAYLGPEPEICRCMPTTTAKVGKGVFAICFETGAENESAKILARGLFDKLGHCVLLPEEKFTAFSALLGAGPAYVFEMMHALIQAGVTLGFSAAQSRPMLETLLAGCAELSARQHDLSCMELRDAVCSPAGLTIAGINRLDRAGFVGILVEAVEAAHMRGLEMES